MDRFEMQQKHFLSMLEKLSEVYGIRLSFIATQILGVTPHTISFWLSGGKISKRTINDYYKRLLNYYKIQEKVGMFSDRFTPL